MVVMWVNTCIMVKCCKQKTATKNSTESELVGTSDCYEDLEWAQDSIEGLGYKMEIPVQWQDNTSTIIIIKDPKAKRLRTKHLTSRKDVLHEAICKNNEALLEYKNTKVMIADAFTKILKDQSFYLIMNVVMRWMSMTKLERVTEPKSVDLTQATEPKSKGMRWK